MSVSASIRRSREPVDQQHPAPGLEPPRAVRMPPGPHRVKAGDDTIALSTVICVDLDYGDLVAPVRAAGGFLAAPANDWLGRFAELHCRSSVWAAVMSGVAIVRATGHGISAVFDGAGRMLASQSSERGPVLLVRDIPVAAPTPD